MANIKWSAFTNVGALQASDVLVGLRAGVNVRFTAPIYGSQIVVVITPTQAMSSNTIYIANAAASLVTLTLPAASSVGDRISIVGQSANGWTIAQGAGQQIQVSPLSTTLGAGGSLSSTNRYDSIDLICIVANTIWTCLGGGQTTGFTIV
jgi:hypothetical protein